MDEKDRKLQEHAMIGRICGVTLALLSFSAVCLNGLRQGNSFGSVTVRSLIALAVGGVTGLVAATIIRRIVKDEFNRVHRREEVSGGATTQDKGAARTAADRRNETAGQPAGSAGR
ncbi:MAG: hypothetical protein JXL80_01290 [Planctomycetes bacterium]|nr:hypothetical protein [Planctomycetota bacterium]